MYRDTTSDGDFADAGDVNVYYLQDRLFNVVALTDTDGAIVERTWYEPYESQPTAESRMGMRRSPATLATRCCSADTGWMTRLGCSTPGTGRCSCAWTMEPT